MRSFFGFAVSISCAAFLLAGCSSTTPATQASARVVPVYTGMVHGGQQPVTGSTLQLYAVGTTGDGAAATPLLLSTFTTSDGTGNAANSNANAANGLNSFPAGAFTLTGLYTCPTASTEVYLTATGGNPGLSSGTNNTALAMMAALGTCGSLSSSTYIFLNELTTVGSIAALFPYMTSASHVASGSSDATSLQAAFSTVAEYTNTSTGTVPGPSLPSSTYASSVEIDTLADVLATCINSTGGAAGDGSNCGQLFTDAKPSAGSAPTDTVLAALDILKNPSNNVCALFNLLPANPPFVPALSSCPGSWSLPITTLSVAVSGSSSVYVGSTAQYTASVTGASNQSVTWAVNGITGGNSSVGTISTGGLYTPPAITSSTTATITATSTLSSTATGSATVTVTPVTVTVSGALSVAFSQTAQYTAAVTGNSSQSVTWLVNGVSGGTSATGTISTGGLYTAPASAPSTAVAIGAQSTAVPVATGSENLLLAAQAVPLATGDARTVTQPTYPTVCQTLTAVFSSSQRSSPPSASSDDTTRIQTALNTCKNTGQSVVLASSGSNDSFYAAELSVQGEGLVLSSGVTLFGNDAYANQSYLLYITGTSSSLMGPGTLDGRGDILSVSYPSSNARLVEASSTTNFTAYNVTLKESIKPNLYVEDGSGFTAWNVTIRTPATRTNADGIDIDSLTNATVINSSVEAGDDGIAIKTNSAAISNVTISNNYFYGTHGISIGSQTYRGVSNILFTGNTLNGMDLLGNQSGNANGVNIKTDPTCGGTVQQVTYQNTCLKNVKHLIILNTNYGACSGTAGTPQFSNIVVNGVYATSSESGAYSQFTGQSAGVPVNAYLANISLDTTSQSASNQYANVALFNSNLTPSGTGITTSSFSISGSVPSCSF